MNGDYTAMADWYELVIAGYYDHDAFAANLAAVPGVRSVLEFGCGTGDALQRLLKQATYERVAGVDGTPAMLAEAVIKLGAAVELYEADVTTLEPPGKPFDLGFSVGGPWYFVPDGGGGYAMVSHIPGDHENEVSLQRAAACLRPGGRLMLCIQPAHTSYSEPRDGGYTYMQQVVPQPGGFRKTYELTRDSDGERVMRQVTHYRLFSHWQAFGMLADAGLQPVPPDECAGPLFLEFTRSWT